MFRDQSWWCLGNLMWCRGSNLGWLQGKCLTPPLLSLLLLVFPLIKFQSLIFHYLKEKINFNAQLCTCNNKSLCSTLPKFAISWTFEVLSGLKRSNLHSYFSVVFYAPPSLLISRPLLSFVVNQCNFAYKITQTNRSLNKPEYFDSDLRVSNVRNSKLKLLRH